MKREAVSGSILALLLMGVTLVFNIHSAVATGTIYIRANGVIDPPTAPISTVDYVTYTLTGNIASAVDGIVVERSNIVFDGNGHTLQGNRSGTGMKLLQVENVTVRNTMVTNFYVGILLYASSNNTIIGNSIAENAYNGIALDIDAFHNRIVGNSITANEMWGIFLSDVCDYNNASGNTIANNGYGGIGMNGAWQRIIGNNIIGNGFGIAGSYAGLSSIIGNSITENDKGISLGHYNDGSIIGNTIANNGYGIWLSQLASHNSISGNSITANGAGIVFIEEAAGNSVIGNTIANNGVGIELRVSNGFFPWNNDIYHNNFDYNTDQVYSDVADDSASAWDDMYPSGGNYWSDYAGVDFYNGLYQDQPGSDGLGDTPYIIDPNNQDNYPLMNPWTGVPAILAVRGANNGIYYRLHSTSDSWSEWYSLPGATSDSPAVALLGTEAHFVVRGMEANSLWHGHVDLDTQAFSGWTWISGSTPSAPTLTSDGTSLCLVVRGGDNGIYYRFYSSGSWGSWLHISDGSTIDTPAAALAGSNLHIIVRGSDGYSLWHSVVGGSPKAWTLVGGATDVRPVVVAFYDFMYLAVKGLDGGIYFLVYGFVQDAWVSEWIHESGGTCDGPAITVSNREFLVVVRGSDGNSLWHRHISDVPWSLIDGTTPSEPTLAGSS